MREFLHDGAQQSHNPDHRTEFLKWERCARLVLDVEDELDRGPAGVPDIEAILRRIVAAQEAGSAGSCVVDVAVGHEISRRQAILCALLIHDWRVQSSAGLSTADPERHRVSMRSIENQPASRINLSLSGTPAAELERSGERFERW